MFKSKKSIDPGSTDTLIGEHTVFEGEIHSEASIRIEGSVNGKVNTTGDVTVGQLGKVNSSIHARSVTLAGTVHGDITVQEKIVITSTGQLHGNLFAKSFVIEEGGIFQGSSKMVHETKENSEGISEENAYANHA